MIKIDEDNGLISVIRDNNTHTYPLDSPQAFRIISETWLKSGWDTKYVYSFSWLGRPIIQLPEDMIRIQEIITRIKPNIIIETGVAHGGSLIFYASLLKAMDLKAKIIGVDIDIREHNRRAIEEHILFPYIELIEGSSTNAEVVNKVHNYVAEKENPTVLVILDSCHTKEHVLKELELYSPMVSIESFIVATDGIMKLVKGQKRTEDDWDWNNPEAAALDFVNTHHNFRIVEPVFPFNEGEVIDRVTYWPNCFIQRIN